MKCGDALFQEMGIDSEGSQKNDNNNNMNSSSLFSRVNIIMSSS